MKTQFHIDLETLDTEKTSIIVSIGIAIAYPESLTIDRENTFYRVCDTEDQDERTISPGTITFWMKQNDQARSVFSDKSVEQLSDSLSAMVGCILEGSPENEKDVEFFANSPDFDLDILEDALT